MGADNLPFLTPQDSIPENREAAMSAVDKALATQLANIEAKTGKPLDELKALVLGQDTSKHGEMVRWAKTELGLGHGDANTLVHVARKAAEPAVQNSGDPLDDIYTGAKAHQRPIHSALMDRISEFGAFEQAHKKGYISLRRKKQFAMLGPKTNDRFELGINLKDDALHPLMKPVKPGGMCQYIISLHAVDEIDDDMIEIVRRAYDAAG
ncbi:DUF4287 domain-containing protein [Hyphobacterium sp.]|uniref:DUF4287 domain-containing protein n=1 Tax=Hyphobacterium sp. TaxID=2004662 RepID=UPI003B529827